jgi:hypothetical protein
MTSLQKDGLVYATGAVAGALLAKSFGAKVLGLAMGGSAGIAIAAWAILNKTSAMSGEPEAF